MLIIIIIIIIRVFVVVDVDVDVDVEHRDCTLRMLFVTKASSFLTYGEVIHLEHNPPFFQKGDNSNDFASDFSPDETSSTPCYEHPGNPQ